MPSMSNSGSNSQQPKLWTPVFVVIIGFTFCTFVIGQGVNSGSTVYVDRLGGNATLAGMGAAIFSVAAAVSRIAMGPLADKRGRLLIMALGSVMFLVGMVGPALTATLDLFLFWRFVQGIGFAASTTAAATAAADVLPVERLGEGIGYYGLGQALSMSVGPALAITLVSTEPAENLYWGLAVSGALACILCFFCRYEKHPEQLPETATYRTVAKHKAEAMAREEEAQGAGEGEGAPARKRSRIIDSIFEPGALAGAIPVAVLSPVFAFTLFYAGLLGTQMGVGNAGIFYTMSAITMIVVRLASKRFMDRVAAIKIHTVAVAGALITYAIFIFILNAHLEDASVRDILFYLAGIPYGLCPGLALPINQAVAVKNSSAERWGAANGLYLLLTDIVIAAASIIWGITNDTFGFGFTMLCAAAMALLSIGTCLLCYPAADRRFGRTR